MIGPCGTVAADPRARQSRQWHLGIRDDGSLGATLIGSDPPLVVSADSLAGLRKQVMAMMLRARRQAW